MKNKISKFLILVSSVVTLACGCEEKPKCNHEWIETKNYHYLASPSTFTHGATYYKSCSICGEKSNETFSDNTILSSPTLLNEPEEKDLNGLLEVMDVDLGSFNVADLFKGYAFDKSATYKRINFKYESLLLDGTKTELSAAITVPLLNGTPSFKGIMLDHHPTFTDDRDSPSKCWDAFAAGCITQSIVFEFDLLGYGVSSDVPLDYHCRHLLARNTADGILAAYKIFESLFDIDLKNTPIINEGYSQGGYDSLAFLKYMENESTQEEKDAINIIQTCSGSGAYDVEIMLNDMTKHPNFDRPQYLILAFITYYTYHNELFNGLTLEDMFTPYGMEFIEALKEKTDSAIDRVKNERDAQGNKKWTGASSIFTEKVLGDDPEFKEIIHNVAKEECLIDGSWQPKSPLFLYWTKNDEMVAPRCSETAINVFGAKEGINNRIGYIYGTGEHTANAAFFYINVLLLIRKIYSNM